MQIHPELPIYQLAGPGGTALLYTPGTLAVLTEAQAAVLRQAWGCGADAQREEPFPAEQSAWLLDNAREAVAARNRWLGEEYRPECLTVYLSNRCTLRCSYCFAAPARITGQAAMQTAKQAAGVLHPDVFAAAAELVCGNCADKGRAFQLVCHGGGEPTLHWDLVLRLAAISKTVAGRHGVPWNGYIATNGVVSPKRAREMATVFGRVGLSCDGPPDIQDRQRPLSGGGSTSGHVRQTALALKEAGVFLDLRATITPETVSRQAEILEYLVGELGADSVTFEPVYSPGTTGGGHGHGGPNFVNSVNFADAVAPEDWAGHFMRAKREAARRNVALSFSGFRPEEHHGPYCNTLRQSLHLTPDGRATNCFLAVDGNDPRHSAQIIGEFDRRSGRFLLDQARIPLLRERASRIDSPCRTCFAAYHCARSCPDECALTARMSMTGEGAATAEAPFRCRLNRAVGHALLGESALELLREEAEAAVGVSRAHPAGAIAATLAELPRTIREEVLHAREAARPYYRLEDRGLPAPLWEKKGFQYDGEATWARLRQVVNASPPRPVSLYVHIPFCEERCGFCDCYTVSAKTGHPVQADYARRLCLDLQQWSEETALAAWPVTTVHFGGGTPNHLQPAVFASIVETIRAGFHTSQATEWALESTARQLTGPHLDFLRDLGFRRLHIGVQTLEEPLRREIGRREPAATVLERIADCLERGFVTTVDLLYGLPGQTVAGFFSGLEQLDRLGVHGVSLYRFNPSRRNRGFLRRHQYQSDIIKDFAVFAAADSMLTRAGYDKNHFCHYAKPQDRNLYYNHARRGEDLLAVGASADGVFGNLHYRCPHLSRNYLDAARVPPLFQGSVVEDAGNMHVSILAKHLMTGSVPKTLLHEQSLAAIIERWRTCQLIREKEDGSDTFVLTGNGSWHLCAMLGELDTR